MRYALIDEAYTSRETFNTPDYPVFDLPKIVKEQKPDNLEPVAESPLKLVSNDCIKALEHLQTCNKCRKSRSGDSMLLKFIIFILLVVIFFKN